MRILFDQSVHDHRNLGNNSLLQVALERFRSYWPDASYHVISSSPHLCQAYFPGTIPVTPECFQEKRSKIGTLLKIVPKQNWWYLFELREAINGIKNSYGSSKRLRKFSASRASQVPDGNAIVKYPEVGDPASNHSSLEPLNRIAEYDLYSPTGGGYMCDSDKPRLLQVFDRIEAAKIHGVPVVMLGQGVGPMEDPEVLQRAREILPDIDYLMVREERLTRPLLNSLNVPSSKVIMTGDDAIELAYRGRADKLGTGIGISVRVAHYTGLSQDRLHALREVIVRQALKYNADLIAAPTDVNDDDKSYIDVITKYYPKTFSGWRKFEVPEEIIKRINRCRIMISGTFHGAVFALAQGIPVVALAETEEYLNKLSGLTAEFGEDGCQIIHLSDQDMEQKLVEKIDFAWSSAEKLRPQLLENAIRQIDLGVGAYQKIFDLVNDRVW
jgi:polysaccharide pyruvyl transferase WcaK-like protein